MTDFNMASEMALEVVYFDEDLMELAATLNTGYWGGRSTAFTIPAEVSRFAMELLKFADGGQSVQFEAGADNGIGLIGLRFYRINGAGQIAGHARVASGRVPTDHRPEQVWRLAVEFGVEAWAVIGFARQLEEVARIKKGRASLPIETEL